jgi:hypothetical protein
MHPTHISLNVLVLCFRLHNENPFPQTADIGLSNDIAFDGILYASLSSIGSNDGFMIYGSRYAMTWRCRASPLVSAVSTYWFGVYSNRTANNWTQSPVDSLVNIDSGFTVSWQGISVPGNGIATRSLIEKFDIYNADQIMLSLTFPSSPDPLYYMNSIEFPGYVQSSNSSDLLRLLIVIDDDTSRIFRTSTAYPVVNIFVFEFRPSDYSIGEGLHNISFYAVNWEGSISDPQILHLAVIAPTPSPSSSVHPNPTRSPQPTPTRGPAIPIIVDAGNPSFSIVGFVGTSRLATSVSNYSAVIRIGSTLVLLPRGLPVQLSGVTLSMHTTYISSNTAVLAFRLKNYLSTPRTADIGVTSDIFLELDAAPVASIGTGQGFVIYSANYVMTFIDRSYPLVTDLSTYWFGNYRVSHGALASAPLFTGLGIQ